jgi:hypothetical protein
LISIRLHRIVPINSLASQDSWSFLDSGRRPH